ncbi:class I SAM-dependent methyltransferase [Akkermansiaceae bacterium]|nr:class I SAM-dependent methyltransferase [Akkermansiaceae bacterium]
MTTSEPQKIPLGKYRDYKKWGWYRLLPGVWLRWVASPHPVRALEIGAFDGVSANVMLDSIFTHPDSTVDTIDPYLADPTTPQVGPHTRALFEENTRRGCHGGRVRLHVGKSLEVLTRMLADGAVESFDVVFIDGSHRGADVLTDAVLSWPLLRPGGILIFDDYDWGGSISPHRRPKEAIQAFEAAFVESLVPLYRGTQKIYRKVGVPGGLRNERGEALSQTCAIIGTYDSGSSLLSSIMECFGYNIARPTREDFFESASLRDILVRAIDEPGTALRITPDQLVSELAEWHSRIRTEAPALCVKHPLLGLCLPETGRAWGKDTVFIHAKRPLEKSIRGLERRGWFPEPERMQRVIHKCIDDWIGRGNPCLSADYEELLAAPEIAIPKLARDLGINVPGSVIDRAVAMVERRGV